MIRNRWSRLLIKHANFQSKNMEFVDTPVICYAAVADFKKGPQTGERALRLTKTNPQKCPPKIKDQMCCSRPKAGTVKNSDFESSAVAFSYGELGE
jgi:hypothetical protein